MLWMLFALSAALIWAMVNITDKYILSKITREPTVPLMLLGLVNLFAGLSVYLVHGFAPLPFTLLALVGGLGYSLGQYCYFKALSQAEVSRVIPLFYLTPLLIAVGAGVFLGEVFGPATYAGVFCLVGGALLLSVQGGDRSRLTPGFWYMVLAAAALATTEVITKYLFNHQADFWTVFGLIRLGAFISLIPLFMARLGALRSLYQRQGHLVLGAIGANQILNVGGILSLTVANSFGFVTLANALASVQSLFVLALATMLSAWHPKILREATGRLTLARKLAAILIMLWGAYLVS